MSTRGARAPTAERAWQRSRRAGLRWAGWGLLAGAAVGTVVSAPATWLSSALHRATGEHVLLAAARGSLWTGSAVVVLQGGPGSLDASVLPGRLHWSVSPSWSGLQLRLTQPCCLQGELSIALRPAWRSVRIEVPARPDVIGRWPAQWLTGLGTPWNTLQLGGTLQLASTGLTVQRVQGRTSIGGALTIELLDATSRVSAVEPLGSYRFSLRSDAADSSAATVTLDTSDGALRLTGAGQWTGSHLRFRGEAQAAEGHEAGLSNLLNIIGRRRGALSVISIG